MIKIGFVCMYVCVCVLVPEEYVRYPYSWSYGCYGLKLGPLEEQKALSADSPPPSNRF